MSKIIFIGECAIGTALSGRDNLPASASITLYGNIANAAVKAADSGMSVCYVGETARDFPGDMIVRHFEQHGIDTRSIDRYTEGGATTVYFTDSGSTYADVIHSQRPDRRFDTVWPRIDQGDVMVFGNYFALDERYRQQIIDLLEFASERKAVRIYLPGFPMQCAPRITKVMPAILDYLDHSDLIITTSDQLNHIFSEKDAEKAFRNHIRFHTHQAINLSDDARSLTISDATGSQSLELSASCDESSLIAAVAQACMENRLNPHHLLSLL